MSLAADEFCRVSKLEATSVCHIVISTGSPDVTDVGVPVAVVAVPVAADGVPWSPSPPPPPQAASPSTKTEHARKKNTERAVEWPRFVGVIPLFLESLLVSGAEHLVDFSGAQHHAVRAWTGTIPRGCCTPRGDGWPLSRRR